MKYLSFKHYFYIIMLVVILFPGKIFAQSKSVFLNMELGRTSYQEALRQINNSKYKNSYKIQNGSIYIVSSSVAQNDGTKWDHLDIHFSEGFINNIHFHSTSSAHTAEYINQRYQQLKESFQSSNSYSYWYNEDNQLFFKYNGDCAALNVFYSEAAGRVVEVQYIDL